MKKFVLAFLVICLFLVEGISGVAGAETATQYYVVPQGQEIVFYFTEPLGGVSQFVLPQGYSFAYAGNELAEYAMVQYAGLNGRILKSQLQSLTISPTAKPVPDVMVESKDKSIYQQVNATGRVPLTVQDGWILRYLGTLTQNGVEYYAVTIVGAEYPSVYYISKATSNQQQIEETIYPVQEEQSSNNESDIPVISTSGGQENSEFTWVRFFLILGIVCPLLIIIFMIIKPRTRKRKHSREIYDDAAGDYDGIDDL